MVNHPATVSSSALDLERAADELRRGNHREASRLYWEAATQAIEAASECLGFDLKRRRIYADVMELLSPMFPFRRVSKIYSSMMLLKTNAEEDYALGDVWMGELADDIHDLFNMLEFAVSQHGHTDRDSLSVNAQT